MDIYKVFKNNWTHYNARVQIEWIQLNRKVLYHFAIFIIKL